MSQWNSYCITPALKVDHIVYDVACVNQIMMYYSQSICFFLVYNGRQPIVGAVIDTFNNLLHEIVPVPSCIFAGL